MKKRTLSVALATLSAFTLAAPAITINAADSDYIPTSSRRYASEFVYSDAIYWYPNLEAYYQFNSFAPIITREPLVAYTPDRYNYFDNTTGSYVESSMDYLDGVYRISRTNVSNTANQYTSYRAGDGFYYPTLELANEHTDLRDDQVSTTLKQGSGMYFSIYTGNYYSTYSAALSGSNNNASYVMTKLNNSFYDYRYTPIYKNSLTNKYYTSQAAAQNAHKNGVVTSSATPTQGYYFNAATGRFYIYQAEALDATKNAADVIPATSLAYSNGIYNYYPTDSGQMPYYYDGAYNPYPTTTTTPAANTTTNNTVSSGAAYIDSNKAYIGWDDIASYVNSRSNGSSVTVNMNRQVIVPQTFFQDIEDKNVNVTFLNSNGSRFTVNGADIVNPKAINVEITYSVKNCPQSVINEYRSGAVSASQFEMGNGSTFGFDGTITIGFAASRAGNTVRLYLYNEDTEKLKLVDTTTIGSNGRTGFSIDRSGSYVAIILK
jgi:hypothetical protein